jgi:acyl-CoA synthetase (AMP-forming)/AMP-acid ligase II
VSRETGRALWRRRVAVTPERPFLSFEGRTRTFAELDHEVRRLAAGLRALGVEPGTRVLVGMGNRPETVSLQLALHELGAVCVPLLPGLTTAELEFPIGHSRADLLIADEQIASLVEPELERFPALARLVRGVDTLMAAEPLDHEPIHGYDDRSPALVLYTSGSTGRPKGVVLGAGSFHSSGAAFAERFGITAADNFYLPMPLAHAAGAVTALSIVLHTGCGLTLADRFSPSSAWDVIDASGATVSILYPAQLNLLLETDDGSRAPGASSLRLVITHAYLHRFRERFGVELATVWGMTETGAMCAGSEPGYRGEHGETYVGTAMQGVEIGIFDERMRKLPPGALGEICLRHRHVMLGYLDDPEATAKVLVDGWVRSGDQGTMDADGRVFFAGRLKNVIKRSGENVSAEEVEAALAAHPAVSECLVLGVPDRIRSEEVAALVVTRPGAALDPAALYAATADRLVRWKRPRYIVLRDEPLPRLPNGKIDRADARAGLDLRSAWDREAVLGRA